jgi:arabinose-5-phosphate isomerase
MNADIDILSEIIKVIDIEMRGIQNLKNQVNVSFEKAVKEIYHCRGKVVLSGMGKSGIIAKKIASTMSSIGTPATFMHPAEGMHGDIGMMTADDIFIAIGKSGESSELNSLLPAIRNIGVKIIGITGNGKSTLARLADIILDIGDSKEACPFNMAPTTSSTVTLVIGDALAVVLMRMRGFELDDYALLHPGGRLGRRLTMKVTDIMLKEYDNPVINISDTVKNCIMKISEKQAGAVSVIDDNGKLMGLVTDYDIRKHLEKEENIFTMTVSQIMNSNPIYVYEDDKAFESLEFMQKRERPITVMPVINSNKSVVGMLRLQDLVRAGL